jgi:hypothetical protein
MSMAFPARPLPTGSAQRARAKAKRDPGITYLEPEDQAYAVAIHRLNSSGWAADPAELSDWQHERDEVLELLRQARQELYAHLGVFAPTRDYLTLRWTAICGPSFVALVRALRSHLYLNRATGELRELWFVEGTSLAEEMGVSSATFWRVLQRARKGRGAPVYKQFVVRRRRRRYDAAAQACRVTSNEYLVALEDPLTPEDAAWVEARARELLEEKHRLQGESLTALSNCESDSSRNLIEQRDLLEERNQEREDLRSPGRREGFHVAGKAIGNEARNTANGEETGRGAEQTAERRQTEQGKARSAIESDRESTSEKLAAARAGGRERGRVTDLHTREVVVPGVPTLPAAVVLSERAMRAAAAEGVIEHTAEYVLRELGDPAPAGATKSLAMAFAEEGAPEDAMCDLVQLARRRYRRHQMLGAPRPGSPVGYFLVIARNAAKDAARAGWDIARLERQDEKQQVKRLAKADAQARQERRQETWE